MFSFRSRSSRLFHQLTRTWNSKVITPLCGLVALFTNFTQGMEISKSTEGERLKKILVTDISGDFNNLNDASLKLNVFSDYIKRSLSEASSLDWRHHWETGDDRPRPCFPTPQRLIAKLLESLSSMEEAKAIDNVLEFIRGGITVELAPIMTKDFQVVSNLTMTVDHAIRGWESWKPLDRIKKGIKAANLTESNSIKILLDCRLKEQKILLKEYRRGITCALAATQKEWDELQAKMKPCKDDEAALVKLVREFDWKTLKLDPCHLFSVFKSLIQLSLEKAVSDYDYQREAFHTTLELVDEEADTIFCFGVYPAFYTTNAEILKVPCIAAVAPKRKKDNKSKGEDNNNRAKRRKAHSNEKSTAGSSSQHLVINIDDDDSEDLIEEREDEDRTPPPTTAEEGSEGDGSQAKIAEIPREASKASTVKGVGDDEDNSPNSVAPASSGEEGEKGDRSQAKLAETPSEASQAIIVEDGVDHEKRAPNSVVPNDQGVNEGNKTKEVSLCHHLILKGDALRKKKGHSKKLKPIRTKEHPGWPASFF